jgi:hypothetical protein
MSQMSCMEVPPNQLVAQAKMTMSMAIPLLQNVGEDEVDEICRCLVTGNSLRGYSGRCSEGFGVCRTRR